MRQFYDTFSTPVGDFSIAVDANGSIIATAFGGLAELRERFAADEVAHDAARVAAARAGGAGGVGLSPLVFFRGKARTFHPPARPEWHAIPARRLGRAPAH